MSKQGFSDFLKNRIADSTRRVYLPFRQVNQIIARIKGLASFDIYSITTVPDLDEIIQLLNNDPTYPEENKKNHYTSSSALKQYREYLLSTEQAGIDTPIPSSKGGPSPQATPAREISASSQPSTYQIIYFGAPGSGKSKKVQDRIKEMKENTKKVAMYRTTFHPDSDYASFVGCYKPEMVEGKITYTFTPQVFTKAYVHAWEHPEEPVYLVIEEINRGNCAQIFGDIFQLLDRNDEGRSDYPTCADKDLASYLQDTLSGYAKQGIEGGDLCLPPNFYIYATMNTSDQSLFPMDSAFKRRWDWEYIPINYSDEVKSGQFEIAIGEEENQKRYRWVEFLRVINKRILKVTGSEDKQMGNFFIKSSIKEEEFKSKVMAYLWHEVCKDEYGTPNNFFCFPKKGEHNEREEFTFNQLYAGESQTLLQGFMTYLGVRAIGEGGGEKDNE